MDTKNMSKEQKKELNKKTMMGPVESKDMALHIVDQMAKAFYALAALQIIGGLTLTFLYSAGIGLFLSYLFGAAIIAGIAYWLKSSNSRIAAIILCVLGVLSILGSLGSLSTGAYGAGSLAISVLTMWFAVRAYMATSFLAKQAMPSAPSKNA